MVTSVMANVSQSFVRLEVHVDNANSHVVDFKTLRSRTQMSTDSIIASSKSIVINLSSPKFHVNVFNATL